MGYDDSIERELAREPLSAVRLIELLIQHANAIHASDVHLDPSEGVLMIRMRIDGALQDTYELPMRIHREILARLKILAGLRIDEHQTPQDGRFRFSFTESTAGAYVDIRVSIAPTYHGENAVLRLLSSREGLTSLSSLGLTTTQQGLVRRALARPHGLILVTGPTGSGKTSTMYVLLHLLNNRDVSIITIEDPIEYAIDGVNQIQANRRNGLTFAEGLRSILRQDPNVIGIGEIRDQETAALAIHASLTGHLVLSTLHTNNAPSALSRLIDLGIEPYLVSSTVSLVIGERLVRKLCTACRVVQKLTKEQKGKLAKLRSVPMQLHAITTYYVAPGCAECGGTGISGRVGLFEVLEVQGAVREAAGRKVSAQELFDLAYQDGMVPLLTDGLRKASEGLVAIDDVLALAYE